MQLDGTTIAITGAGGFIGRALVRRFVARGARVRGLDVSREAAEAVRTLGAEAIVGDVTEPRDAERLCRDADVVVHTAAVVGEGGNHALYERINVHGTRTIADASRGKRLVHLSSVMVHGFTFPPDVTEDGPLRGEGNAYCETKITSERLVLDRHREGTLEAIVVRPGDVYGVGSQPWVVRPLEMIRKRLFAIPPGGMLNLVHVENLVDGIERALERDAVGEPITISDGVATPCDAYFGELAAMVSGSVTVLPRDLLRVVFTALEKACDAVKVEPPARASAIGFVTRPHRYSIEKARRLLGYAPRISLDEGLREIAAAT